MFKDNLQDIRAFLNQKDDEGKLRSMDALPEVEWPAGGRNNLVLLADTGVELGHPRQAGCAFLFWVDSVSDLIDGRIHLAGPELRESETRDLPFGKVVMVAVDGFNDDNSVDRYRALEAVRFELDLKGYTLRATSQYQREWGRVSIDALRQGFSLQMLGSALIGELKKKSFVQAVEMVFVTTTGADVEELKPTANAVNKKIRAMTKMIEEMDFDCKDCEYVDICGQVNELRKIRNKLMEK